jgi:hypothetical protein
MLLSGLLLINLLYLVAIDVSGNTTNIAYSTPWTTTSFILGVVYNCIAQREGGNPDTERAEDVDATLGRR